MMETNLEMKCAICQVPAKQTCSACKLVHYCNQEHQRQHWKQIHKMECCPFVLASDECLGRYLRAKHSIPEGRTIFVEDPLVIAPKWFLSEEERSARVVVPCVGCYKACPLDGDGAVHCPKCHWPVCALNCWGLKTLWVHGAECEILALGSPPRTRDQRVLLNYYRPDALMVLRCLLLQCHSPEKWKQLMDMQSHEEDRLGTSLQKDAEERIVSYLQQQFFQHLCIKEKIGKQRKSQPGKLSSLEHSDHLLHRICGIIETNYMCINVPDRMELSGLFYKACMMEHSCVPNCYFQFDERRGYRISVVAGKDIARGEHLRIMYTNMLWATHMRQEHLTLTKHFVCGCQRCRDPEELGSYLAALRCTKSRASCSGLLLPLDPLNLKTSWSCNQCKASIQHQQVEYLLTQITAEMEDFMAQKHSVPQVEQMIEKLSEWLHINHYHIFSLKHLLIQLYGNVEGYIHQELDDDTLTRKLQYCQDLYEICIKIDPYVIRLSLYVAVLLYEWSMVLMERFKRLRNNDSILIEIHSKLNQALHILKKEQDNREGQKFSEKILKVLQTAVAALKEETTTSIK